MKNYIFKRHCSDETLKIKGWGYNILPSGDYMILNSSFYDQNPIVKCRDFYLAKVEAL